MAKENTQDTAKGEKGPKKLFSLKMLVLLLLVMILGIGAFFGYKHFWAEEDQNANQAQNMNPGIKKGTYQYGYFAYCPGQ